MPSLIIHGHFYQPPRENPWTDVVEAQPSAAPFHDWNERIHFECYQPNAFVAGTDPATGEPTTTNNYESISFNFGPTLLSWLEKTHQQTYQQIVAADRASALIHDGHGNAFAQAFGHAILPLCNERDLRTQIRWGLADFRYRFGREPEAMWLPESAANDHVLDALIEEGMRYVILEPHQAKRVSTRSGSDWVMEAGRIPADRPQDASAPSWRDVDEDELDPGIPYRYSSPDGAGSIAVFLYDGPTSRAIAFENLLKSSHHLVDAFARA